MNWSELEEKHIREWEAFERLKMKSWELEQKKIEAMKASFGPNQKDFPESVKETLEQSAADWHLQWGKDGVKAKELSELQKIERDTLKITTKQDFYKRLNEGKQMQRSYSNKKEEEHEP